MCDNQKMAAAWSPDNLIPKQYDAICGTYANPVQAVHAALTPKMQVPSTVSPFRSLK